MTKTTKPIIRETLTEFQARPLVLELHATWLVIRQKGRRYRYVVTYDQIWKKGAENALRAAREERAARRKAA